MRARLASSSTASTHRSTLGPSASCARDIINIAFAFTARVAIDVRISFVDEDGSMAPLREICARSSRLLRAACGRSMILECWRAFLSSLAPDLLGESCGIGVTGKTATRV